MTRLSALLIAACLVLAACGAGASSTAGPAPSASPTPATAAGSDAGADGLRETVVMLDWTPNTNHAGLYVAAENGWYADAGLDVRIIQPGEQGGLPALASGDADIAVSVQEALLPARAQGAPVVAIAAVIASNTSSLVALADEGITRPADLVGHRYGGFGGQLETELVRTLVACDGGDPDAVDFVEVGNVDYRAGLDRDFFDFVWIFDGWDGIRLEQAGVETATIPFADHLDCIPDWYTPLLATSEQLIADEPEVVAAFLDATARGYDEAIADPTGAADALLAAAPELDEDLVRASARYLAPRYAPDGAWGVQDAQVWTEFTEFLTDAEVLTTEVDVDAAWTNDFLPASSGAAPTDGATAAAGW